MVKSTLAQQATGTANLADEAVTRLDDATGYLATAARGMEDLQGILEALRDALPKESKTFRLADLGVRLAAGNQEEFAAYTDECNNFVIRLNKEVRK